MSDGGYRDGLAGLEGRIEYERALVDELAAQLTPIRRAVLPREERVAIDALASQLAELDVASAARLPDLAACLEALQGRYARAIEIARERLRIRAGHPPGVALEGRASHVGWLVRTLGQLTGVEPIVDEARVHADVFDEGIPIRLTAAVMEGGGGVLQGPPTRWLVAAASVTMPEALPRVDVTHATSDSELVERVLPLQRDIRVGEGLFDRAFDSAFVVTGDEHVARHVLDRDVRDAMLSLAQYGVRLCVGDASAWVSWTPTSFDASLLDQDGARVVLKGVRRAIERG